MFLGGRRKMENSSRERIGHKRAMRTTRIALASLFFLSSISFLTFYLASPLSKCGAILVTSDNKGVNRASDVEGKSVAIDSDSILGQMGLSSSDYSLFVDAEGASERLRNAPFVCSSYEPIVSKGPFSLSVSFHDLFPMVSIGGEVYLDDGTKYPSSIGDESSAKDKWVFENYPLDEDGYVPFLEDESLGDDHTISIPKLFDVWKLLEIDSLKAVRYVAGSDSFLFYWINSNDIALRINVSSSLLYAFGHNGYDEGIERIGGELLSGHEAIEDDSCNTSSDGWYTLKFQQDPDSGAYHLDYDDKEVV